MALDQIPTAERTPNPSQVPMEAGLGIVSFFFPFLFFFFFFCMMFLELFETDA